MNHGSLIDLWMFMVALMGWAAAFGFWIGCRYGRARALLSGKERHARSRAIAGAHYGAWKGNLDRIVDVLGTQQKTLATHLQGIQSRPPIVVDWQLIMTLVHAAGYTMVRPEGERAQGEKVH